MPKPINDYLETGVSFQFLNYWNFNGGGGRNDDVYGTLDRDVVDMTFRATWFNR